MTSAKLARFALLFCLALVLTGAALADDWPQWRGANRDGNVTGFIAPAMWPKTLTKKWRTKVGAGDSSPVLVGDKVYVFSRQNNDEVIVCLAADTGKELWRDKYAAQGATGGGGGIHAGPRATPAVAEGKVCTFGANGHLSCLDATTGKLVWRKDTGNLPTFFAAASPLIVDSKCITYVGGGGGGGGGKGKGGGKGGGGGGGSGGLSAFDLATGQVKWTWTGGGPSYGSPILATVGGTKQIIALTEKSVVGIGVADGKLLWQAAFAATQYNTSTPIFHEQTVICSGPGAGTAAFKIEKQGTSFSAKQVWKKSQGASKYNTPVIKDDVLYGLTGGTRTTLFCLNAVTGDTLWTEKTGWGECGEILAAGPVMMALTSNSDLFVFEPSKKGYKQLARYAVADSPTWPYPVISGNRVFVKDQTGITLWLIE